MQLREAAAPQNDVYIIMLTSMGQEQDKLKGRGGNG